MQLILEKLSRYWQMRVAAVAAGVLLITYALVMPVHSDVAGNDGPSVPSQVTTITKVTHPVVTASTDTAQSTHSTQMHSADNSTPAPVALNPEAIADFTRAARLYQGGKLSVDFSETDKDLQIRANAGDPVAEFLLGQAYEVGLGLPKDMRQTTEWFARAAAASRAAMASQPAPKSFAEAFDLTMKSAERGDPNAELYIGLAYDLGQGVPHSGAEAARWYRKAASQGSYAAENNLGVLDHAGDGLPKDDAEAALWFERAANHGSAAGQFNLGCMYYSGEGRPRDLIQASRWIGKSARQGNVPAQVVLSLMYAGGEGVPVNLATAYMWLNLASATDADARASREMLESVVPQDQVAEGQRLTRQWIAQHPRSL
jgi:TPR repeat protein